MSIKYLLLRDLMNNYNLCYSYLYDIPKFVINKINVVMMNNLYLMYKNISNYFIF